MNRHVTPGEELGGVDQAPVDVFERLAAVADAGQVAAADFDFLGGGLAGQHAEVKRAQGGAVVGGRAEDLAQDGPGPGLGPVVDQRAIHQEQGLGNRAQDVVVGDRGIDAEEPIEEQPWSARSLQRRRLSCRPATASPAASAAFLAAPLV